MDDILLREETLKENMLYDGAILKLNVDSVTLPNGREAKREYVSHRGGAAILALDEEKNVYLVRQFRYPYKEILLEIPAGKLEIGEPPIETAKRELMEETGLSGDVIPFGKLYPSPGYTNEIIHIFLAENLTKHTENPDEDEFLDVVKIPFETLLAEVKNGNIKDGKTCYAVLKYAVEFGK